ncbi:G-X-X-X-Q-X-W domain-containing protein [Crassisporium funariophilum]|nr:G-X-X-X-Q-X-W domain-containing protein [Crassisporium funariophilum]
MLFAVAFILISSLPLSLCHSHWTYQNLCPQDIDLFINGQDQGSLEPSGGSMKQTLDDNWSGEIYTTANGGNANSAGTTRAGFWGNTNYYYIIKDSNSFNTGVSIVPSLPLSTDGFCAAVTCDTTSCSSSYSQPPTTFPSPTNVAPEPPLFQCKGDDVEFTVTFCPERAFPPPESSVLIRLSGNSASCMDVGAAPFVNGAAVRVVDCNSGPGQRWMMGSGSNSQIVLAGTGMCLDAGTNPTNGEGIQISQCSDDLSAQKWSFTAASQIQLASTGQCLDPTDGAPFIVQVSPCHSADDGQIWSMSSL